LLWCIWCMLFYNTNSMGFFQCLRFVAPAPQNWADQSCHQNATFEILGSATQCSAQVFAKQNIFLCANSLHLTQIIILEIIKWHSMIIS